MKSIKSPFFSIIIPLYNKEKYIEATLNSVIKQTFNDVEIIIINDGSTDNSIQIIHTLNLPNLTLFNQENQGVSAARNKGITLAKGKYIAFLDADDYWYPNHLMELNESIEHFPNEHIFCTNYEMEFSNYIKKTNFSIKINAKHNLITNYFNASLKNSIASTPSICIHKTIFKDHLFDTTIKSGQDTCLWIELALRYNFVFNRTVTVKHIRHAINSLSKSNLIDDRYRCIQKYKNEEKKDFSLKKYLDMNRFSIALQYKRNKEPLNFWKTANDINLLNLPIKRILLLYLPLQAIKILDSIKKS